MELFDFICFDRPDVIKRKEKKSFIYWLAFNIDCDLYRQTVLYQTVRASVNNKDYVVVYVFDWSSSILYHCGLNQPSSSERNGGFQNNSNLIGYPVFPVTQLFRFPIVPYHFQFVRIFQEWIMGLLACYFLPSIINCLPHWSAFFQCRAEPGY